MNCKVIINKDSGNFAKLNKNKLCSLWGKECKVEYIDSESKWSAEEFKNVVVCGGDGTLHHALHQCKNTKLYYVPCGTLNETSLTDTAIDNVGKVNDDYFCYVCAAGSFTEIGYSAKNQNKQRWKGWAYVAQIGKSYRCHNIKASLNLDGKHFDGRYTLLMVIKSDRCFGFCFNKDYKKTKQTYLLAIKSPGEDSIKNRVKIFFPFFRIFFCGVKPKIASKWMLVPFENLEMATEKEEVFCCDGEKRTYGGNLHFSRQTLDTPITVLRKEIFR